jgi:hypothetical protein
MKKLAILSIVLLTTSCAVSEQNASEQGTPATVETQNNSEESPSQPSPTDNSEVTNETPDPPSTEAQLSENDATSEETADSEEAPDEEQSEDTAEPADTSPPSAETVNSYIDFLRVAPEVTSGYDRDFDVDHMVPLKEAWDSGANSWDSSTRERFANDLGSPHSLIAVSRGSNRSKGAKDPAEWMPPRQSYTCEYIFTWTLVKIRWSLSADPAEINALRNLGGDCLVADMNFSPAVSEAEIIAGDPPEPAPEPQPTPSADGELDPRFSSCRAW